MEYVEAKVSLRIQQSPGIPSSESGFSSGPSYLRNSAAMVRILFVQTPDRSLLSFPLSRHTEAATRMICLLLTALVIIHTLSVIAANVIPTRATRLTDVHKPERTNDERTAKDVKDKHISTYVHDSSNGGLGGLTIVVCTLHKSFMDPAS